MKNELTEEFRQLVSTLQKHIEDLHEKEKEAYEAKMGTNLFFQEAEALPERMSMLVLAFKAASNELWIGLLDGIKENVPTSLRKKFESPCVNAQVRDMEYRVQDLLLLGCVSQALVLKLIRPEFAFKGMEDFLKKCGASHLADLVSQRIETLVPEQGPARG